MITLAGAFGFLCFQDRYRKTVLLGLFKYLVSVPSSLFCSKLFFIVYSHSFPSFIPSLYPSSHSLIESYTRHLPSLIEASFIVNSKTAIMLSNIVLPVLLSLSLSNALPVGIPSAVVTREVPQEHSHSTKLLSGCSTTGPPILTKSRRPTRCCSSSSSD